MLHPDVNASFQYAYVSMNSSPPPKKRVYCRKVTPTKWKIPIALPGAQATMQGSGPAIPRKSFVTSQSMPAGVPVHGWPISAPVQVFPRNCSSATAPKSSRWNPMRKCAGWPRNLQETYPAFRITDGTAESTGLPDASVDFVVAATAFHWFDPARSRAEFGRILKPGGSVVLLRKERLTSTPYQQAYEALLVRFERGYKNGWGFQRERLGAAASAFFTPDICESAHFVHAQHHDSQGLKDRLLSSSYAPLPGDPAFESTMTALEELFESHQENGTVAMEYEASVFHGKPGTGNTSGYHSQAHKTQSLRHV